MRIEAGQGVLVGVDGAQTPLTPGDYVYVAPEEMHNSGNIGGTPFEFICIVSGRGEPPPTG